MRYRIRIREYPAVNPFTNGDRVDLIDRYNTHMQWIVDTKVMAKKDMPKTSTHNMKWIELN